MRAWYTRDGGSVLREALGARLLLSRDAREYPRKGARSPRVTSVTV